MLRALRQFVCAVALDDGLAEAVELADEARGDLVEVLVRLAVDLEAEPAYKRRQVILDDIDHSSKSQGSRFTLHEETDEEGERTIELRNDNPFLHDNVD